ncbi:MAG: alpha/beta hydrolase, partial [Actinobacteria bacterium]|nr:alpha/beta hydrolase [Actinomycetota bacterium]
PQQFGEFGQQLFEDGANVLILRAPRHGRANSEGDGVGSVSNVESLTASELRDYADDAIDIATGLGDEVRVLGLSMGGVLASWTGQNRDDVDRVVAVAPALGIPGVPGFLTTGFINLFDKLPNVSLPGRSELDHVYAGEGTKGLVATFLLGRATEASTYRTGPAASEVVVVVNPDDDEAPPAIVIPFAERWARQDGRVVLLTLPAVGLPHDVIDPDQPDGDTSLVYPILYEALNGKTP